MNSAIAECYFIVIGIPYLFIVNLLVVDYLVLILSTYSKKFYNDGQKKYNNHRTYFNLYHYPSRHLICDARHCVYACSDDQLLFTDDKSVGR